MKMKPLSAESSSLPKRARIEKAAFGPSWSETEMCEKMMGSMTSLGRASRTTAPLAIHCLLRGLCCTRATTDETREDFKLASKPQHAAQHRVVALTAKENSSLFVF